MTPFAFAPTFAESIQAGLAYNDGLKARGGLPVCESAEAATAWYLRLKGEPDVPRCVLCWTPDYFRLGWQVTPAGARYCPGCAPFRRAG